MSKRPYVWPHHAYLDGTPQQQEPGSDGSANASEDPRTRPKPTTVHRSRTQSESSGSPSTAAQTGMSAGRPKHPQRNPDGTAGEHWQEAAGPFTYEHKTPSQSPKPKPLAAHVQTRLPPNSGSPSTAVAASSFSSSISSSPSPSLNPYTGSLRSMFHPPATNTHVGMSPSPRTSGDGSFPSRNNQASLLPANIRRTSFQQQQQLQQQSRPRTPTTSFAADDLAQEELTETRSPRASQAGATAAGRTVQSTSPAAASASVQTAGSRDARCEQIVQNFYSKAVQVIAHLRNRTLVSSLAHRFDTSVDIDGSNATLPPRLGANAPGHASGAASDQASANSSIIDAAGATGRRVNKWFNLDLEDIDGTKSEVKFWRNAAIKCAATLSATQPAANPPTMFIEVCLDVSALPPGAELQVTDIFGRPWTVDLESGGSGFVSAPPPRRPASRQGGYRQPLHTQHESRQRHASTIVLEVWRLDLATNQLPQPVPDLPRVYKQAIIFFRSLYAFASLLPTMSLIKRLHGTQEPEDLDVFCSVRPDLSPRDGVLDLDVSFTGTERFLESYQFEPVATPMGAFLMSVQYRRECGFMYNPAMYEQQLGDMPGIGAIDDTYFTPTLSSRNNSNFSLHRMAHHQSLPQQQQPQQQQFGVARRATLTTIPSHGRQPSATHSPPMRPQHTTPSTSLSAANQSTSGNRSLTAPSVNPFRARPLSTGDSSSLPSYLSDSFAPRVPSRLSSESHRQNDTYPRRASGRDVVRDQQRRISVGGRSYLSGHGDESGDPASLDQKISSLGQLSTSGGHGGPDSGSILHRGVMIRRLGGSLSPTDSHRPTHQHHGSSPGAGSAEAVASGSKSPPWYASLASRPSVTGSVGSSASRSGLAFVSPFKSPSVSSSPSRIMDTAIASGLHDPHGQPLNATPTPTGLSHIMGGVSESPTSIASTGSGHSRGLASSFDKRRGSNSRRRSSILAMSPTSNTGAANLPGMSRRHTIVEGQQWSGEQEIDDFIRMVDENKSLKIFGKRPGSNADSSSADAPTVSQATSVQGRRNTLNSGDRQALRNQQPARVLTKYHGLVNEFDGLSRDMQESIAQLHVDTTNLSGASNDGDMAGSPFLRKAIPNPFKSADSTIRSASRSGFDSPVRSAGPSRPVSNKQTDASPKQPSSSKAPSSTGMADGTKRSLRSLEEAFKGMVIDSQPDALPTTGFYSPPTVAMLPGGHIRDAAPGLDSEREQPLPLPMSIPRTNSGTARTPQPLQRVLRTRPDDIFDTPPPPLFSGARGKSQPTSNMPIYSPATAPRAVTPQPPAQTFTTQPGSTHHPVPMLAPRRTSHVQIAHRSLSQSPDSHHSDYTASTRRLEALLGMGESSPRSTPNTPSPGDSTSYRIFKDLPQPVDLRDARSGGESRRRKQQTATTLRRQDSLKSNFPPFSFIMPRNKIDNPAGEQMAYSAGTRAHAVGTSSPPSRSDMALSNESLSPLADKNECDNDDDDEEMMFQMEASIE